MNRYYGKRNPENSISAGREGKRAGFMNGNGSASQG